MKTLEQGPFDRDELPTSEFGDGGDLKMEKENRAWPVSFAPDGAIMGLPAEIAPKDIILFLGNDGKWYAGKPTPELIAEKKLWRADW